MNTQNYTNYEYMTVSAKRNAVAETANRYESLGWQLDGQTQGASSVSKSILTFKRDRSIKNKTELNRLQAKIEDGSNGIEHLEASKTKVATVAASVIGSAGALILGSGMSLVLLNPVGATLAFIGGIALGVVGGAICGVAALLYRIFAKRKAAKVNPIIEKKKDELAELCGEANRLAVCA